MPRQKTDSYYQERVAALAEQGHKPPTIAHLIKEEAEKAGRVDYPSERTVRRIYQEHDEKSLEQRREHAPFFWPDSMEEAGLPWDTSRVLLDVLHWCDQNELSRPTIAQVKWCWRVYLAAPGIDYSDIVLAGFMLAGWEQYRGISNAGKPVAKAIESYLAYKPWKWPWGEGDYETAGARLSDLFDSNEIHALWMIKGGRPLYIPSLFHFIELAVTEGNPWSPDNRWGPGKLWSARSDRSEWIDEAKRDAPHAAKLSQKRQPTAVVKWLNRFYGRDYMEGTRF